MSRGSVVAILVGVLIGQVIGRAVLGWWPFERHYHTLAGQRVSCAQMDSAYEAERAWNDSTRAMLARPRVSVSHPSNTRHADSCEVRR